MEVCQGNHSSYHRYLYNLHNYKIQMDEQEQKLYHRGPKNKQIRTYTNLHMSSNEADNMNPNIRQSFKSVNNLNSTELHEEVKYRRLSNEPAHYPTDRQQSKNKSKPKSSYIKYKNKSNGETGKPHNEIQNEADSQKETIKVCNDRLSRYETIVNITEEENQNLKQQNRYLLEKLRKMQAREDKIKKLYEKTKNYKLRWMEVKNEIDIVREQSYIYRSLLQDFKEIALVDIPVLKQKVEDTRQAVENEAHDTNHKMNKQKRQRACYNQSPAAKQKKKSRSYESIMQLAQETQQQTFQQLQNNKQQKDQQEQDQLTKYSPTI